MKQEHILKNQEFQKLYWNYICCNEVDFLTNNRYRDIVLKIFDSIDTENLKPGYPLDTFQQIRDFEQLNIRNMYSVISKNNDSDGLKIFYSFFDINDSKNTNESISEFKKIARLIDDTIYQNTTEIISFYGFDNIFF